MTGRISDRALVLDATFEALGNADLFPEVAPQVDGAMANDRYTTKPTLEWCKRVLGVEAFDLDVAACCESHKADRWFGWVPFEGQTKGDNVFVNAIEQAWDGKRIWCNPPYDDLEPWVMKAWNTVFDAATLTVDRLKTHTPPVIGMLIPDNRREQPFWQNWIEPWRDGRWEKLALVDMHNESKGRIQVAHDYGARLFTHSLPGRQPFGVPGNPEGVGQQSPPFGVVLLEWRFT